VRIQPADARDRGGATAGVAGAGGSRAPGILRHVTLPRTVALVPCYGGIIDVECEQSLRELERRGIQVWRAPGYAAIDKARSVLASRALREGYEALVWIDADITFRADDVCALVASGEPFVGGLYPKKGRRELAAHLLPETREILFGRRGSVLEVRYLGAGFLCTAAEVYRRMLPELPLCDERFGDPFVPFFLPAVVDDGPERHWYLAEDYAFCERARRSGFRILADSRVRLGHAGRYVYSWEDAGGSLERFDDYRFVVV
jgi:hypothetical protein